MKQYENLDQEQIQGSLIINENYYSFLLLLILVGFILYILFKFTKFFPSRSTSSVPFVQQGGSFDLFSVNTYYLLFAIILMILLFIYYQTIIQTTSTTANDMGSLFTSIFNTLSGGLSSGGVFDFN